MTVCKFLECKHNNRQDISLCSLDRPIEIDEHGRCPFFEADYDYLRAQGRERDQLRPWLKPNAGKINERKMRVLICGDRHWSDEETIENYIKTLPPRSVVIQGMCKGADRIARRLALKYGHSEMPFSAKWGKYGRAAGPKRNTEMLDEGDPDLVVAFHDNIEESKGTKDMIEQTRNRGITYKIIMSKNMEAKNEGMSVPEVVGTGNKTEG